MTQKEEPRTTVQEKWMWRTTAVLENGQEAEYHFSDLDWEDEFGHWRNGLKNMLSHIESKHKSKVVAHKVTCWILRTVTQDYEDEFETKVVTTQKKNVQTQRLDNNRLFTYQDLEKEFEKYRDRLENR